MQDEFAHEIVKACPLYKIVYSCINDGYFIPPLLLCQSQGVLVGSDKLI